ncbi:hypothetical protein CVT24_001677 [Panaeolus cyanescens]|uniref:Uncharacterized protein n=1 Tax=Panaeolus cyanescens TaxID=181874 RepID=A0A409X4M7_9AGAR|nr:hypothetical protein CVT24_001677 [Panaeolus cyanescens]
MKRNHQHNVQHPSTTILKRPDLAHYVRNITETGEYKLLPP